MLFQNYIQNKLAPTPKPRKRTTGGIAKQSTKQTPQPPKSIFDDEVKQKPSSIHQFSSPNKDSITNEVIDILILC